MPALTRGPLPPSVYWRRRLIVLTVVLLLLWSVLHLLGGGDGTPKASPAADLTGASARSSSANPSPSASTSASSTPTAGATTSTEPSTAPAVSETPSPTPTVLPTPTGACPASDVSVTPSVAAATAGTNVAIVLTLRTFATPACTWHVGHKTMQVKVSNGDGDVWSTVQCPTALTSSEVVLYKDVPTPVTLTWSARPSDAECSTHTAWSKAGGYTVTGVALGGVPAQATFTLGAPVAAAPPPAQPSATPTAGATPDGTTSAPTSSTASDPAGSTPAKPKKKHEQKAD